MDLGSILLGAALLVIVAFYVARPIFEKRGGRDKPVTEADRLTAERENILAALRDLDFDHITGKITDEDFAPQRAALVAEGASIYQRLEQLGLMAAPQAGRSGKQAVASRQRQ